MSQLDTAIQTLVDEHGTFITKANDYHARKDAARAGAVSDATGAEQAQAGAEGAETTTDQHEADALAARDTAQADQRAAHVAKRQAEDEVLQAKRARLHAEAVQAGDLDRYTQWLLDSPVAGGTLGMSFGSVRDPSQEALVMDFENSDYQVFEVTPEHFVYT